MKIRSGARLESQIIAVDFDGTCVTHEFPRLGRDIDAAQVLRRLVAEGHKLILWTMRSGQHLTEAQGWFLRNGIELWSTNVNPQQASWTRSPKAFANMYIDDAALGIPLTWDPGSLNERSYVDWREIERLLEARGLLEESRD